MIDEVYTNHKIRIFCYILLKKKLINAVCFEREIFKIPTLSFRSDVQTLESESPLAKCVQKLMLGLNNLLYLQEMNFT